MKLHLPVRLRSALLACCAAVTSIVTTVGTGAIAGGAFVAVVAAQQAAAATAVDVTGTWTYDTADDAIKTAISAEGNTEYSLSLNASSVTLTVNQAIYLSQVTVGATSPTTVTMYLGDGGSISAVTENAQWGGGCINFGEGVKGDGGSITLNVDVSEAQLATLTSDGTWSRVLLDTPVNDNNGIWNLSDAKALNLNVTGLDGYTVRTELATSPDDIGENEVGLYLEGGDVLYIVAKASGSVDPAYTTIDLAMPNNGATDNEGVQKNRAQALVDFASKADGGYMFNNGGAVSTSQDTGEGILKTENGVTSLTLCPRAGAGGSGEAIVLSCTEIANQLVSSFTLDIADSSSDSITGSVFLTLAVVKTEDAGATWNVYEKAEGSLTIGESANLALDLTEVIDEWTADYKVVAMIDNTDKTLVGNSGDLYTLEGISISATGELTPVLPISKENLKSYFSFATNNEPTYNDGVTWSDLPTRNDAGYATATGTAGNMKTNNAGLTGAHFTVSFDINNVTNGTIFSMSQGAMSQAWRSIEMRVEDGGSLVTSFLGKTDNDYTTTIATNKWTSLTLVGYKHTEEVDGANKDFLVLDLYVNGEYSGTSKTEGANLIYNNTINNLQFGYLGTPDKNASMDLDNIVLYNSALTAEQVEALYNALHSTSATSTLVWGALNTTGTWNEKAANTPWYNDDNEASAYVDGKTYDVEFAGIEDGTQTAYAIDIAAAVDVNEMTVKGDDAFTFTKSGEGALNIKKGLTVLAGATATLNVGDLDVKALSNAGTLSFDGAVTATSVTNSGTLNAASITATGAFVSTGGTVKLTGDNATLAADSIEISGTILDGTWGATGAVLGTGVSVAADGNVTLTDATLGATVTNAGTLNLSGSLSIGDAVTSTDGTVYSDGDNGFKTGSTNYQLVTGGTLNAGGVTAVQKDGVAVEDGKYSFDGNNLNIRGEQDGTLYWVNGGDAVTYDGTGFDGATGFALNGSANGLVLDSAITDMTDGVQVQSGTNNKLTIGQDVVMTQNKLTVADGGTVTLHGSGTYELGADASALSSGVSLGADWTGTVVISTKNYQGNHLGSCANNNSTVKFQGAAGYLHWNVSNVYNFNLILEDTDDAPALTISDASVDRSYTFNGAVSGSGSIEFALPPDNIGNRPNYTFAGKVADWSGGFKMNSADKTASVLFTGGGDINASTSVEAGTLNVTIGHDTEKTTVNSSIAGTNVTITGDTEVADGGSLSVAETGTLTVNADKSLTINGSATLDGNVDNDGTLTINKATTIGGNVANDGTMSITGNATINGELSGAGDLTVSDGSLTLNGATNAAGSLSADSLALGSNQLTVAGALNIGGLSITDLDDCHMEVGSVAGLGEIALQYADIAGKANNSVVTILTSGTAIEDSALTDFGLSVQGAGGIATAITSDVWTDEVGDNITYKYTLSTSEDKLSIILTKTLEMNKEYVMWAGSDTNNTWYSGQEDTDADAWVQHVPGETFDGEAGEYYDDPGHFSPDAENIIFLDGRGDNHVIKVDNSLYSKDGNTYEIVGIANPTVESILVDFNDPTNANSYELVSLPGKDAQLTILNNLNIKNGGIEIGMGVTVGGGIDSNGEKTEGLVIVGDTGNLKITETGTLTTGEMEGTDSAVITNAGKLTVGTIDVATLTNTGTLNVTNGTIGTLAGDTGRLEVAESGEVTIGSDTIIGTLDNGGTLTVEGSLQVTDSVDAGGTLTAGSLQLGAAGDKDAEFEKLVINDGGTVNAGNLTVGDGSSLGAATVTGLTTQGDVSASSINTGTLDNGGTLDVTGDVTVTDTITDGNGGTLSAANVTLVNAGTGEGIDATFTKLDVDGTLNAGDLTVGDGSSLGAATVTGLTTKDASTVTMDSLSADSLSIGEGSDVTIEHSGATETALDSLDNNGTLHLWGGTLNLANGTTNGGSVDGNAVQIGDDSTFDSLNVYTVTDNGADKNLTVGEGSTITDLNVGSLTVTETATEDDAVTIGTSSSTTELESIGGAGAVTIKGDLNLTGTTGGSADVDVSGIGTLTISGAGDDALGQVEADELALGLGDVVVDGVLLTVESMDVDSINLTGDTVTEGVYDVLKFTGDLSDETLAAYQEKLQLNSDALQELASQGGWVKLEAADGVLSMNIMDQETAKADGLVNEWTVGDTTTTNGLVVVDNAVVPFYRALDNVDTVIVSSERDTIDLTDASGNGNYEDVENGDLPLQINNLAGTGTLTIKGDGAVDAVSIYGSDADSAISLDVQNVAVSFAKKPTKMMMRMAPPVVTNPDVTLNDYSVSGAAEQLVDLNLLVKGTLSLTGGNLRVGDGTLEIQKGLVGDAASTITGVATISGTAEGGSTYEGSYGTDTTLHVTGGKQTLATGANLTANAVGSDTTLILTGNKAITALEATSGATVVLTETADAETPALTADKVTIDGADLEITLNTNDAVKSMSDGPVILAADGSADVANLTVNLTPATTVDVPTGEGAETVALALLMDGASAESVTLATDDTTKTMLEKFFTLDSAVVNGDGYIVVDRNDDYFTEEANKKNLLEDENAKAGAAMLDRALVYANPQGNADDYAQLADIMTAMEGYTSAGNAKELNKLVASVAGASTASMGAALSGDMQRQLRAIRNRTTTMGVDQCVVNHDMPYFNAWINAEGNRAELDADGLNSGYTMDSWGGTVGFDVDATPQLTFGLALTAMYGDFTANSAETASGDMDSYYLTAFARYVSGRWTHTFVAAAGKSEASLERNVLGYDLKGDTDGTSIGMMYEVGYVYALDEDATACLQPVLNFTFSHSSMAGYTEKGGDAALNVGDMDMTTFTIGAGARLQASVGENLYNRTSVLEARALVKFNVGDTECEGENSIAAIPGSGASVTSADMGAVGFEFGAGLTIPVGQENGSIFVDASAEISSGYTNVNGTVGYRMNF